VFFKEGAMNAHPFYFIITGWSLSALQRKAKGGGPDEPDNILIVCTACHKQVHFLQCYFNRYLAEYFKAVNHE